MEQRHAIRPTVTVWLVLLILVGCGDESDSTGPRSDGPPTVASVVVTPDSAALSSIGETVQLSASARDASGNVISGKTFAWSSSNTSGATVTASGLVTAVANGSAVITATTEGRSGTASISVDVVPAPVLTSIEVTPVGPVTLTFPGATRALTAVAKDAGGAVMEGVGFTWASDNVAVAAVASDGIVTAAANGSATILASASGVASNPVVVNVSLPGTTLAVGAGNDFSCALRTGGAVFCWGSNRSGQLGDGTPRPSATPVAVSGNLTFDQLIVGDLNACGITITGVAYCWGSNQRGQLGAGLPSSAVSSNVPVLVAGGHRFNNLSIGLATTCGVATDGVTYCWGNNQGGTLGDGSSCCESNVPVAVVNSASLGFVSVTSGFFNTCALDGAGAVFCWGMDQGRFGNGTPGASSLTPTSAASGWTLATIRAGNFYFCGLATGGSAVCWGSDNLGGELGIGSLAEPAVPTLVAGGLVFSSLDPNDNNNSRAHTCGITIPTGAWCWGSNEFGQLGGPSVERCTSPTDTFDCSSRPVLVSGNHPFTSIAVGIRHVCGVTLDRNVLCWGQNDGGQLGDGTLEDSPVPVLVVGL